MKKILLLFSVVLLLAACNDSQNDAALGNYRFDANATQAMEVADVKSGRMSAKKMKSSPVSKVDNLNVKRKLIKTGNVEFETKDLETTKTTILNLVKQYNAYIARDNQYKSYDRISTTLSVRIPAESFDKILEGIVKGVEKFDHKNIHISDVTEQFLDVEARLKTKKALELKYLEILKKAKTVREILDVERELGKLRGDIEATEGRLKYLKNQVAFSTLNITFYKKVIESETGFGGKIGEAFKKGFENIKVFFVSMITIWPFIIILFLLIFYFRKRIKRTKS